MSAKEHAMFRLKPSLMTAGLVEACSASPAALFPRKLPRSSLPPRPRCKGRSSGVAAGDRQFQLQERAAAPKPRQ